MIEYREQLKIIISSTDLNDFENLINTLSKFLSEKDLASFFVDSIYLKNVIQHLIEAHWLQSKNSTAELRFHMFIKPFLNDELKPLLYLHSYFSSSQIEDMTIAVKSLEQSEKLLLNCIRSKTGEFKKKFLQIALAQMSELYESEHQLHSKQKQTPHTTLSLYRTFDILDQIFELDYILNETSLIDQKERLYKGAGVGVQSSYATTLLALRYLNLPKGSRFIDLGSGYGRIGLVIGLMKPDIQFTGYEFVQERVDIANKASIYFNLNQHVRFITQDLSKSDFKIPSAETYYIFDSFTDATYALITEQLQNIALQKKITIVTKGNAKLWFKNKYWSIPQEFNDGNLCFFRSKGSHN